MKETKIRSKLKRKQGERKVSLRRGVCHLCREEEKVDRARKDRECSVTEVGSELGRGQAHQG